MWIYLGYLSVSLLALAGALEIFPDPANAGLARASRLSLVVAVVFLVGSLLMFVISRQS